MLDVLVRMNYNMASKSVNLNETIVKASLEAPHCPPEVG